MKPLYLNILLGAVAFIALGFGAYEYWAAHPGLFASRTAQQAAAPGAQAPQLFDKATDGSWKLRCRQDDPTKCVGIANVANKNGQLVMIWTVGMNRAGGLVLTIQTPTGVALAPGVDLVLDANPAHHMPFGACGPRLCSAGLVLDAGTAEEMRKAAKMEVSFVANGRKVAFSVPVTGTDKMLTDLGPATASPAPAPAATSKATPAKPAK